MKNMKYLKDKLYKIDKKGYKAYKSIQDKYKFKNFILYIDHVQSDPYASPSKIRIVCPQKISKIPSEYFETRTRKTACCDYLSRNVYRNIKKIASGNRGSGKSGAIYINKGQQEVLPRSSIRISKSFVEARLSIGLPAKGRRVLAKQAFYMLCKELPKIVSSSLLMKSINKKQIQKHIATVEDAEYIRNNLSSKGLVCFIKNNSILPRQSGIDSRPLKNNSVPFKSPPGMEVEFFVPNRGRITGMGIPEGVTLIVGGGYHGKSTLLNAIQLGIYNHIPRDGREYVVTNEDAIKIRAEDGRNIKKVNISGFIDNLPSDIDSKKFSTENASGSTSQAANILESIEIGAKLLLIDEDTSATNFMIRDLKMQKLVPAKKEPITPLIDRIKDLNEDFKISTILIMGGSGDYLNVADRIIMMDSYKPYDVTNKAKKIAKQDSIRRKKEKKTKIEVTNRKINPKSINPHIGRKIKIKARGKYKIQFGKSNIDLSALEQIVDTGQTRLIGNCLYYLAKNHLDKKTTFKQAIEQLYTQLITQGLDSIVDKKRKYINNYALARKYEIAASLNRLRTLEVI